ncbi:MAG TPA: 6-oxocyclohex-1-ene-1-carbonyl-CoA hydratase, partial [Planctomycetota bacterium]|nr:6-oxocyclohex-1-ene-1-carbonyl-CoA hydratase [Planctomycetota bacterium]
MPLKNHDLTDRAEIQGLRYQKLPLHDSQGEVVDGLHSVQITLDNPAQLNSYTTEMVKGVILAMRRASNDRACVAVVFTGAGTRAFCTGGNTAEYAEVYAGRPEEYRQYMRLFNDMVSAILHCDKPVICRVNGMRIAGGQEIGMACDFSVAQDLASFGQAGPRHGSAPDGGSTDFLPLFVGLERAMESCTLCEPWSAHKAYRLGLLTAIVPALRVDGRLLPNPLVVTDRWLDEQGRIVHGEPKAGAERQAAKELLARGSVDLSALDQEVDRLVTKLALTMPGCLAKTIESVRKHKLEHWDRNRESNRAWLALNMATEGKVGFRAFHEGGPGCREADFLMLRRRIA